MLAGRTSADGVSARTHDRLAFVHAEQLRAMATERGRRVEDSLDEYNGGASDLWRALDTAALDAADR